MDPKRKKIYIILIIVCFATSAAILGWSFLGSSNSQSSIPLAQTVDPSIPAVTGSNSASSVGFQDFSSGYTSPLVYPASDEFDTAGVDSDTFKGLNGYAPLSIDQQIGRDNPFKNFPK